jgi:hypothetical protein
MSDDTYLSGFDRYICNIEGNTQVKFTWKKYNIHFKMQ